MLSFDIIGEDNSIFAGAVVMVMILNKSRLSLNEILKTSFKPGEIYIAIITDEKWLTDLNGLKESPSSVN